MGKSPGLLVSIIILVVVLQAIHVEASNSDYIIKASRGNAILLDGEHDWIEVNNVERLPRGNEPSTICAWLLLTRPPSEWKIIKDGSKFSHAISYGYPNLGEARAIGYYTEDFNDIYFRSGVYWSDYAITVRAELGSVLMRWVHVCMVYDGSREYLYVNGELVGSKIVHLDTRTEDGFFRIGRQVNSQPEFFPGAIDEVLVYDRALSQAEIASIINGRYPRQGLLVYFSFDDYNGGDYVYDDLNAGFCGVVHGHPKIIRDEDIDYYSIWPIGTIENKPIYHIRVNDNGRIAVVYDHGFAVFDINGTLVAREDLDTPVTSSCWLDDDTLVLPFQSNDEIVLYNVKYKKVIRRISLDYTPDSVGCFNNGPVKRIYAAGCCNRVSYYDLNTGDSREVGLSGSTWAEGLAVNARAREILVGVDNRLYLLNLELDIIKSIKIGVDNLDINHVAWLNDSVAVVGGDNPRGYYFLVNLDDGEYNILESEDYPPHFEYHGYPVGAIEASNLYILYHPDGLLQVGAGSRIHYLVRTGPGDAVDYDNGLLVVGQVDGTVSLILLSLNAGTLTIKATPYTQVNVTGKCCPTTFTMAEGSKTLQLLAGTYWITYKLPQPPHYIGPASILAGAETVSISPGQASKIIIPSLETVAGKIVVRGPPGVIVSFSWSGGTHEYGLGEDGVLQLYGAPGEYTITYRLKPPQSFIGDKSLLEGAMQVKVTPGATVNVTIPNASSALGILEVRGPPGLRVNVTWKTGHQTLRIPDNGTLRVYATPGHYQVAYKLQAPTPIVGGEGILEGIRYVDVGRERLVEVRIPSPGELLARIILEGPPGIVIKITWSQGAYTTTLGGDGRLTLYATPGSYTIEYNLTLAQAIGGGVEHYARNLTIAAGENYTVTLETLEDLVGTLALRVPGGSLLTIEWLTKWGAGLKTIYLANGTATLHLVPGNYTIRLEKKDWPQLYQEKTVKLHVEPGGSYTVEFQSYPHSLQYYTLITIIIIAVYLSTLHPHTIIGSVTAQPVIQGKPATITVEVWKLGLIPKTHNIKIIIDNKEINIGTICLTKSRKYKIKIIIKDENTNLEII